MASNQVFSNRTAKYLSGRRVSGTYSIQNLPSPAKLPLTIGATLERDLPVTTTPTSIIVNEAMTIIINATIGAAGLISDPVFSIEINNVNKARFCVSQVTSICANMTSIVNVIPGDVIEFKCFCNIGGIILDTVSSGWVIVRLF